MNTPKRLRRARPALRPRLSSAATVRLVGK